MLRSEKVKKEWMKIIILPMAAMTVLSGCKAEEADIREQKKEAELEEQIEETEGQTAETVKGGEEVEADEETAQKETAEDGDKEYTEESPLDHWSYFGYEDEFSGSMAQDFRDQDYDNDGIYDRVYREPAGDTELVHYRIELGNGIVIDMDKGVYGTGFPHVKGADINGDGENEIVFSLTYDTSTDMRGFGDMAVYEKNGDTYEKAKLPFQEAEEGYEQTIAVLYEPVHEIHENLMRVSVDGYETLVPINTYQWGNLSYSTCFNEEMEGTVWDNYILNDNGEEKLVCKIHLFDKWSWYGLFAVLGYEDGAYRVDEWWRISEDGFWHENEEYTGDSPWELDEYRICRKELETENGVYIVELWLEEGIYGSDQEFGPGGGIYEENYIGAYYLTVTDEEGEVLSKRELKQDFAQGDQMNFPGGFEILTADYNQDGCPDFTIGSYGSSAVNLYALYTIKADGKLALLGKDIPACSPGEFSVVFEQGAHQSFLGSMWDNAAGERRPVVYVWEEGQETYAEAVKEP